MSLVVSKQHLRSSRWTPLDLLRSERSICAPIQSAKSPGGIVIRYAVLKNCGSGTRRQQDVPTRFVFRLFAFARSSFYRLLKELVKMEIQKKKIGFWMNIRSEALPTSQHLSWFALCFVLWNVANSPAILSMPHRYTRPRRQVLQ